MLVMLVAQTDLTFSSGGLQRGIARKALYSVIVCFGLIFSTSNQKLPAQTSLIRAERGISLLSRAEQLAVKAAWARLPITAIKLSMLQTRTLSKAEVVALLIEKAISEGRIPLNQEVRIHRLAMELEEGDKILLRFLQSDARQFDKFRETFGLVKGGDSAVLGEAILKPPGPDWAAHHIIPTELRDHRVLEKIGFDLDVASNGIALPTKANVSPILPLHSGSHPSYTSAVKKALDEIPSNLPEAQTRKLVDSVQRNFRDQIQKGTPLHEKYGGLWE